MCRKLVGPDFVQYRDLTAHNDFDMEFLEALAQALVDTKEIGWIALLLKMMIWRFCFKTQYCCPSPPEDTHGTFREGFFLQS